MPLFFELASSLNVELVYVILKSITQFAYVKYLATEGDDGQVKFSGKKKTAARLEVDEQTGDATLSLN